ncbi:DUF418 domain-containing protein [Gramella sp. MT6]|uniref:DUF418 domain-containing protein n=1 Tax=Gramella sp. MT6 TaxID=2705471 RepID=UPI001C606522|nr:DUF418 domain-containing protein [Gramella sp. MT6]
MEAKPTSLTPINASQRISSLDIMRGIVLFGILLMNINGFGLAGAYANPTVTGGATGWNLYTWIGTTMFFEGTMRALFSLLFGVGMFILLSRLEQKGAGIKAADIYFRRLLWLLVFGLIHGYLLLWTGEILYDYALMGFLVYSFRNLKAKTLFISALLLFSVGTVWNYFEYRQDIKMLDQVELAKEYKASGMALTSDMEEATASWAEIEKSRSPEKVAETTQNMRKDYFSVVAFLAPKNMKTDTSWFYRYDVWDILSMMLLGIALFKWNILNAKKSYKFYGLVVLVCYAIGLSVNYYEVKMIMAGNFSFLSMAKAGITYDLGRLFMAMGHVGLIMIFCKLPVLKWLQDSLSAVGKMALTNYVMHSVICMFIFTGVGFGLFGSFQRYELLFIVFGIWVFQLIVSPIWLRYFYFGPLEWVWRNLSYKKNHLLRRQRAEPSVIPESPVG